MTVDYQQLIKVIEFWRESIHSDELQDRDVFGAVDLKSCGIIDLVGPRRSGKSSYCQTARTKRQLPFYLFYRRHLHLKQ